MFGIGFWESIIVLTAIVIFVKPEDIPAFVRHVGRVYGYIKRSYDDMLRNLRSIDSSIRQETSNWSGGQQKNRQPRQPQARQNKRYRKPRRPQSQQKQQQKPQKTKNGDGPLLQEELLKREKSYLFHGSTAEIMERGPQNKGDDQDDDIKHPPWAAGKTGKPKDNTRLRRCRPRRRKKNTQKSDTSQAGKQSKKRPAQSNQNKAGSQPPQHKLNRRPLPNNE